METNIFQRSLQRPLNNRLKTKKEGEAIVNAIWKTLLVQSEKAKEDYNARCPQSRQDYPKYSKR